MKSTIDQMGWFLFLLSGLIAGDKTFTDEYCSSESYCKLGIKTLVREFKSLAENHFARVSRTGWWTIEHSMLGTITWKSGIDFRTGKEYFLLRHKGRDVLRYLPEPGGYYQNIWQHPHVDESLRTMVDYKLLSNE